MSKQNYGVMMKYLFATLLFFFLSCDIFNEEGDVQFKVSLDKQSFAADGDVSGTYKITNDTDETIKITNPSYVSIIIKSMYFKIFTTKLYSDYKTIIIY